MNGRILVVEDNPTNMILMQTLLSRSGHQVIEAVDVPHARQVLAKEEVDLVLLDFQLPGENGDVLMREIRADPELAWLPVVAVTASVMPGDKEFLMEAGCDAFCEKPINIKRFPVDLQQWLALGARRQEGPS